MKRRLSRVLRRIIGILPVDLIEAGLYRAVLNRKFAEILSSPGIAKREDVWRYALDTIGKNKKILFLEFGVYAGDSFRWFCRELTNPSSTMVGFDSFVGLPEKWGSKAVGTFSVAGRSPDMQDPRASFVKGWFQETLPGFIVPSDPFDAVLIHMDADLYSSTLFVLTELWHRFPTMYVIFDEFINHECRALYNFQQAFPCKLEFLAHDHALPSRVLCKINRLFEPRERL